MSFASFISGATSETFTIPAIICGTINAGTINGSSIGVASPCFAASNLATQTAAVINTAYDVLFTSNDLVRPGITHSTSVNPQNFVIVAAGVYLITISAQVATGAASTMAVWSNINTVDVPNSASIVDVPVGGVNVLLDMQWLQAFAAGDVLKFRYATTDISTSLSASAAAPPVPAVPSISATIQWVSV